MTSVDPARCRALAEFSAALGRQCGGGDLLEIATQLRAAADSAERYAKLEHDLGNAQQRCLALEHTAEAIAAENAEAKAAVLLQAARLRALESELATLQASVVAALSSAGPGEDERSP